MKSRLLFLLVTVIVSGTVKANCAVLPKHSGRLVVASCEAIDKFNYPYVGMAARCLETARNFCGPILEAYAGVIINTVDEKFFFKDASRTACDSLEAGDILQANVERERCDGDGGGVPCNLGFDLYITEYKKEQ